MAKKILVVDDDQNLTKLVESRLRANKFETIVAHSGKECLSKLIFEKPDLVLLDVMMPEADGLTVLMVMNKIKEIIPKVPVIIMTGTDNQQLKILIERQGIAGFVTKPFDAQVLIDQINKIFNQE
ncbi:MAG: response regulator [Candidatus Omnitrophota bacterium]